MIAATRNYVSDVWEAWNEFWFTPTSPATLSAIRVLAGAMLLYTHFVWSFDLDAFFGPNGWLPPQFMEQVHETVKAPDDTWPHLRWSHVTLLNKVQSPVLLWTAHLAALAVFFLLMVGLFSRTMAMLAFLLTISYATRITPGAYFGLDKINAMLAMYLMLGPCGARYSVDRLLQLRRGAAEVLPSAGANLAVRMIQIHMCIIYLFSGLAKLQGPDWVAGEATWLSFALSEYRSLDMTWMVRYPRLLNFMTHATIFWELSYCALVWPRLTRPWVLLMAVMVHGGIVLFLGMPTFGLVMLIGNLAFVSPQAVRRVFDPVAGRISLAIVGKPGRGGGAD
jgi:hypothetical protein